MKHELLVPVGNYESLIQAINNGADGVYLGGKKYSARAFSDNFTLEELEKAVKLCHLYNVKIYITLNTLVFEDEIKDAINYINYLYEIGIDALIMQDIGLISIVRDYFPLLDIHSSTQMHNHSADNIDFLKTLGVKRLVFARELSLKQINEIQTDLEKEAFIHGALCVSYSGQCYFSKSIMNRSANRGECAGMCRLPYSLYEDNKLVKTAGKFILSPKDLCSFNYIKELMDSNIYSFKIEGRMKSPLYVATVTRVYKKLMTDYEDGKISKINDIDLDNLKAVYYRGFTNGNIHNDKNIMNYTSCNHVGLKVGDVINVKNKKVVIKLEKDIYQNEGIRFKNADIGINLNFIYDKNNKLVNKGLKGEIISIDNFFNLQNNDEVYLTSPKYEIDKNVTKKIPIKCVIKIKKNENININIIDKFDKNIFVEHVGPIPELAKNLSSKKEDIIKNIIKTGNTAFYFENANKDIELDLDDGLFVPVKLINEVRRDALDKLTNLKECSNKRETEKKTLNFINANGSNSEFSKDENNNEINLFINAKNKTQIEYLLKEQNKQNNEINEYGKITNKNYKININIIVDSLELANIYKNKVYYKMSRNLLNYNIGDLQNKLLVTSYASMYKYQQNVCDYFLNITNSFAFNEIEKYCSNVCLSIENDIVDIKNIANNVFNKNKLTVFVFGRIELMMMKNCLIGNALYNEKNIHSNDFNTNECSACKENHNYILVDRNNEKYPIVTNNNTHSSYILDYKNFDYTEQIPELIKFGVRNYRIDLFDEKDEDIKYLISKILNYCK